MNPTKVEFEFQYLDHDGIWQVGSVETDKKRAINHFKRMTDKFPSEGYRLVQRTTTDKILKKRL